MHCCSVASVPSSILGGGGWGGEPGGPSATRVKRSEREERGVELTCGGEQFFMKYHFCPAHLRFVELGVTGV